MCDLILGSKEITTQGLLHKGCEAYLAHVVDTSTPKVTLRSVLAVREFLDVFFKDLLSHPKSEM